MKTIFADDPVQLSKKCFFERNCILGVASEDDLAVFMKDMEQDRCRPGIFKKEGQKSVGQASCCLFRLQVKMEDLCAALIEVIPGLDPVDTDLQRFFFAVVLGSRFKLVDDDPESF